MFNLFKKKVELKNTNTLMNSITTGKGLKINSEITVPTNFECLIYYNSKHYITLSSGKHTVNANLLPHLCEKQAKHISKSKRIKFIAHFINLSKQKLKIIIKKKQCLVEFKVINSLKFAEWILLYNYRTDNNYTSVCINDLFREILIRTSVIEQVNRIINKFGIAVTQLEYEHIKSSFMENDLLDDKVSIFNDASTNILANQNNITANSNINSGLKQESIVNQQNNPRTELIKKEQLSEGSFANDALNLSNQPAISQCPKCKTTIKFKTTYCLHCGYKLDD